MVRPPSAVEKVKAMPERFLSVTEAKKSFCELVREADKTFDRVIITRGGHPVAVLLAYDDYAGMEETIEIMSDPELVKAIREGEEDIRAGRTISLEDFERELARDASTRTQQPIRRTSKGAAARRTRPLARRA
jgi:prevent-host-death family protein